MKLDQLRRQFLDYFSGQQHVLMPSAPLIPRHDPTLMFVNAGMVPFKNIFTGKETAPEPPRAVSSQKCVRAGGKHNDLDNVGYTARHHTFFEMLGNFSFGDYFKERAITHAWTLLTKELGLDPSRLYATVYHTDDEAYTLWRKIAGLPEERIMRIATSDNFWAMGETGPCGPCSEVFFDHGGEAAPGEWALNADGSDRFGDRFIEIWNLVFMQYEQLDADTRIDLPKPCVDTGMGLERMAAVMQGVHDNYDIDIFANLMAATEDVLRCKADGDNRASFKVIADHLRSCGFLIADGVLPSNEGRGYVLRRIMRRAMRHGHMLGAREPMMHQLVPALLAEMGSAYPELTRADALITATLQSEEERFRRTLGRGLKMLEEARAELPDDGVLSGELAFKLYDTYGFPLDLTQDMLRSSGQEVDLAGFEAAMAEQKARARANWKGSGESATSALWLELRDRLGGSEFLGYSHDRASGAVQALVVDGQEQPSVTGPASIHLVVNQTPAYAESGGQVGDTGWLSRDGGVIAHITDVQMPATGLYVHNIELADGVTLHTGESLELAIDTQRRARIRANHSATHLLHAALRHRLGEHVTQKGSLVADDRLRFDFSHTASVTNEELQLLERDVNEIIWQNAPVTTRVMHPDDAITEGAMALFGENYGDEVRVLSMGYQLREESDDPNTPLAPYSLELCGGTHVGRTGDIGLFTIVSEAAISAGVRRIEAFTRDAAYDYATHQREALRQCAGMLTVSAEAVPERLAALQEERRNLTNQLAEAKKQLALSGGSGGSTVSEDSIAGITYRSRHVDGLPPKELRGLAQEMLEGRETTLVAVTTTYEGKGSVVVALSPDLTSEHKAADYVRPAVAAMGGKGGGGKPEMAQGGGPEGEKGPEALKAIRTALEQNSDAA